MASPKRRKTTSSPSRTAIPSSPSPSPSPPSDPARKLNEDFDAVAQVFVRLPIKSIARFKCVSTTWQKWLSDPLLRGRQTTSGLFLSSPLHPPFMVPSLVKLDPQISTPSFAAVAPAASLTILSSSNGLLLLSSSSSSSQDLPVTYFVYNPCTDRARRLPSPPGPIEFPPALAFDPAFRPARSPHYEVISVRRCQQELAFEIQIYSSKAGSWRTSAGGSFIVPDGFKFCRGVCWNGCVHWMGQGFGVYFNPEEDGVREMPLVPLHRGWDFWDEELDYFGESGGHLHYILIDERPSTVIHVYEMRNDYSEWFCRFIVNLNEVQVVYPEMNLKLENDELIVDYIKLAFRIMSVVRCEADGQSYLVLRIPGRIVKFHLETEAVEEIARMEEPFELWKWKWYDVHQYIRNLAAV